jgi:phage portal protein BeeE
MKIIETRNGKVGIVKSHDFFTNDCSDGNYIPLIRNDTVYSCINYVATIVASISIKQYEYNETGGKKSIYDGLTRILNDLPNDTQTRYTFMHDLVSRILIDGEAYAIMVPQKITVQGEKKIGIGQIILVDGVNSLNGKYFANGQSIDPKDLMIFTNSSISVTLSALLKEVIKNLSLGDETKSVFYSGAYMPNLLFKVNSDSDLWDTEKSEVDESGRPIVTETRVEKIINRFFKPKKGNPIVIPDGKFEMEQIKPLSMKDIALNESIQLDKKRVASIIGVPGYVVGEGVFTEVEFTHFVSTKIAPLCIMIEKELTRKILFSNTRAFSFNVNSLLRGKPSERLAIYQTMGTLGAITSNEVRESEGFDWLEGGDEIIIIGGGVAETLSNINKKSEGGD